jgi:hypothetical protein
MLLIDKPYVSELLINTIKKNNYKVVGTEQARNIAATLEEQFVDEKEAVKLYEKNPKIYVNSENTISWINEKLSHTDLPKQVAIFKDKGAFRQMLSPLYPDFRFKKINISDLNSYDPTDFGFPFVIKPAVGFFSMGIYVIENEAEWKQALEDLEIELEQVKGVYPDVVMNSQEFLIEQLLDGSEYAVDVYFDGEGKPVILNIYEHIFPHAKDVNDRAYFTSIKVIERTRERFEEKLEFIGKETGIKNFPMHIEWRITSKGEAVPIESNPLRFAGWCMTDLTKFAWGINPYEYFLEQKRPDWDTIFENKTGRQYNAIIADIPRDIPLEKIDYIDYKKFEGDFGNLLHNNKTDYRTYPVFSFAFSETRIGDQKEVDHFLHSDLTEYIVLK